MRNADPLPRFANDVVLRRLAVSDLPVFQAYRNDPLIAQYQDWWAKSDEEASAFLTKMNTAPLLQPGKWSQIGIADPDGLGLIGDIGRPSGGNRRCPQSPVHSPPAASRHAHDRVT